MLIREAIEQLQVFEDENPGGNLKMRCCGFHALREPVFMEFFPIPGDGHPAIVVESSEH